MFENFFCNLKVCREECETLESVICKWEYVIAKKHPLIGQKDFLPTCADLPPSQWPDGEECIKLGVPNMVQIVQVTHGKSFYLYALVDLFLTWLL